MFKVIEKIKELKKELIETIDDSERAIKSSLNDLEAYKGLPQYMKKKLYKISVNTNTLVEILNLLLEEAQEENEDED